MKMIFFSKLGKQIYLYINYQQNHSFLNYRRNGDKAKYLFPNHRKIEEIQMHLSLTFEGMKNMEHICSSTIKETKKF